MIAEYAATYGGPPASELPWPLFVLLVRRTARFQARSLVTALLGGGADLSASSEGLQLQALAFGQAASSGHPRAPRLLVKQSPEA